MLIPRWRSEASRKITRRIIIAGELELATPAHFSNGDSVDVTDIPVAADFRDGKSPILTGTSIAGALRSYLRSRESGYFVKSAKVSLCTALFGGNKGQDDGLQSPLVVDDARGKAPGVEVRDGVAINRKSRTAEQDKLYSRQLWQAGTTFDLRFELLLGENEGENERRKQALALALQGLNRGEITFGARKRRGYGRAKVTVWKAETFDLKTKAGLFAWLEQGARGPNTEVQLETILGAAPTLNRRRSFGIKAQFKLDSSVLIRGHTAVDVGPDMEHLHSWRPNRSRIDQIQSEQGIPVLSGTSLAGALRARARKIVNTLLLPTRLAEDEKNRTAKELIDCMFGSEDAAAGNPQASRLIVHESEIENGEIDLVQHRVSIDRFTGGALDAALFTEAPVFTRDNARVCVRLELQNPRPAEIGLLLLLVKDLWTSDLAIGGESSVGRGRLIGDTAILTSLRGGKDNSLQRSWTLKENGNGLLISGNNRRHLQKYLDRLLHYLAHAGEVA